MVTTVDLLILGHLVVDETTTTIIKAVAVVDGLTIKTTNAITTALYVARLGAGYLLLRFFYIIFCFLFVF
jgi:hypothetical protein